MKRKDQQVIGRMLLLVGILFVASCSSSEDETSTVGDWTRTTPFKGRPRSGAVTFTIGNAAFVGLGYDGDDYLLDFYMYDLDAGFWVAVDPFPGDARQRAVAFSIGSKGYVGTGYDGDSYNSDFWQYDPTTNDWTEIESYPGEKIWEGLAFVIGEKAYICTGRNNGLHNTDFWEFNPSETTWTSLTPDDDESYYDEFEAAVARHDASALVVDNKAYIIGGLVSSATGTVYVFDPATLVWDDRTSFEGSARSLAIAFTLDGNTFYGTGQNGTSRYDDIWQFDPTVEYDESY